MSCIFSVGAVSSLLSNEARRKKGHLLTEITVQHTKDEAMKKIFLTESYNLPTRKAKFCIEEYQKITIFYVTQEKRNQNKILQMKN